MIFDSRWQEVTRLAGGLRRVVETISYSIPPLDELEFELSQARWYLDQIEKHVRKSRKRERNRLIRLVFGSTLSPEERN